VIVDTHTHVVAVDRTRWPLNPAGVGSDWFERDPVPVEDLARVTAEAGVGAVVLVQAYGAYTFDNAYVVDAAAHDLTRLVSIGIIDAEAPDAIETLRGLAARPGFTGIRLFPLADPSGPQPEWLDDRRTFPVWEACAELGLRIVVCMLPPNFGRLRRVLDEFPDQAVVLDHCGFADVSGGPPFGGAAELFACAEHANLHLKVTSGVLEAAEAGGHDPRDLVDRLVTEFGADRMVWGTDYPQTRDRSYADLVALGRHACSRLAPSDADLVLGGTALRLWPELAGSRETAP